VHTFVSPQVGFEVPPPQNGRVGLIRDLLRPILESGAPVPPVVYRPPPDVEIVIDDSPLPAHPDALPRPLMPVMRGAAVAAAAGRGGGAAAELLGARPPRVALHTGDSFDASGGEEENGEEVG
jgi:hypothetical protein